MSMALSKASGSAWMPLEKHTERVCRELETHITNLILLADEPVGYLVYLCHVDPEDQSVVLQVHRLFIKAAHRRKGLGRDAVEQVLEAHSSGTQIVLAVKPDNETALAFYKALGFDVSLLTLKKVL